MIIDGNVIRQEDLAKPTVIEYMQKYICESEAMLHSQESMMVPKVAKQVTKSYPSVHSEDEAVTFRSKENLLEEAKQSLTEEDKLKIYEKYLGLGYTLPQILNCETHCGLDKMNSYFLSHKIN